MCVKTRRSRSEFRRPFSTPQPAFFGHAVGNTVLSTFLTLFSAIFQVYVHGAVTVSNLIPNCYDIHAKKHENELCFDGTSLTGPPTSSDTKNRSKSNWVLVEYSPHFPNLSPSISLYCIYTTFYRHFKCHHIKK